MADNPGLLYSLGACFIGVFLAATEAMPLFNKTLEIVKMPSYGFTRTLIVILLWDVMGAFLWDQLTLFIFARHIWLASVQSMTSTDIRKFMKMAMISFVIIYIFSNIDYEELERQQMLYDAEATTESDVGMSS